MVKHACRTRTPQPPDSSEAEPGQHRLVRLIAWHVFSRLPKQTSIELSDLIQAGHLGLLRARGSYLPENNVPFLAYARYRIRGEILDVLRRLDHAPRSLRRWQRASDERSRELTLVLHRAPTDQELGDALGSEIETVRRNRLALWSLPDEQDLSQIDWIATRDSMPDAIQERRESMRILLNTISSLAPRARRVVLLYYQQDLTMKQIGAILRVNESRVSQIHKTALRSMSVILRSAGIRERHLPHPKKNAPTP